LKKSLAAAALGLTSLALFVRAGGVASLLNANYLPHRFCYLAQPGLIWTNAATDALIAVSYAILFACLCWISVRLKNVSGFHPYLWIFLSFAAFILACGATHAMEVMTVWWPVYRLSAAMKVLCAATSVPTAILFARVTPGLVRKFPKVLDALTLKEQERDEARAELLVARETMIGQQIAAQVAAEKAHAAAEVATAHQMMNHILDSTSDGVLKIDLAWTMVYGNRKAIELVPDFRVGKNFWQTFPEIKATYVEQNLRRAMTERVEVEYELYYQRYDAWYRINLYPSPGGLSMFFTLISAQKRLEQQLVAERTAALAEINSVMDSTSDCVMKIGTDWTVLYGNRQAFDALPDLVIGRNYWLCFPAAAGTEAEQNLRKCMEDRVPISYERFYEPYKQWFSVNGFPTEGGISAFFKTITERKQLEQQLEAERLLREKRIEALSHLAGGLAHEISNPLAIIHGTASDLHRQAGEDNPIPAIDALKASETIVRTSDRAIRILRGLRGFAREAGNDPMEYASIFEIVEQAIQMQEGRFTRLNVELRPQIPMHLPLILCRETQIGQIVTNLVNNAYDAIVEQNCEQRWVLIEARVAGDWLEMDVSDSGRGVDEEARAHLMEPFFTTKTRGLGMGVGLSLSRAIAHDHGGTLELLQDTPNTCFRLTLPLVNPEVDGEGFVLRRPDEN
jgi:signal transduction histidine kinase